MCPECAAGKHANCDGTAWDFDLDDRVACMCDCHDHEGGDDAEPVQ